MVEQVEFHLRLQFFSNMGLSLYKVTYSVYAITLVVNLPMLQGNTNGSSFIHSVIKSGLLIALSWGSVRIF